MRFLALRRAAGMMHGSFRMFLGGVFVGLGGFLMRFGGVRMSLRSVLVSLGGYRV
jgi:hypothetical protein